MNLGEETQASFENSKNSLVAEERSYWIVGLGSYCMSSVNVWNTMVEYMSFHDTGVRPRRGANA
ncbi:hypothetical protein N7447_003367 [Penicillium robsamsonii]|uniref:uncharacterized protein n=1 Tax=Penicillium robsamsonii TaxID=1792511 RepID=UPI002548D0F8|nr:uncharacterized protein N7447_003367 [Penicillium robsamsonii]KAJ5826604.1 hypothetical protein N7447_003367 [Penicillium robsamsonii]